MKSTIVAAAVSALSVLALAGCNPQTLIENDIQSQIEKAIQDSRNGALTSLVKKTLPDATRKGAKPDQQQLDDALELHSLGKVAECLERLRPLVEQDHPKAEYLAGRCYSDPTRLKDTGKSEKLLNKSLTGLKAMESLGDIEASYYLACIDLRKGQTVAGHVRLKKIIREIKALSEKGNPIWQQRLASMYYHGWGVEQDVVAALDLFEKCSARGYVYSSYLLGHYYLKGNAAVQADFRKAKTCFAKAADAGYALAQTELGWQLYHSRSAAEKTRGLELLVQARLQNEPVAADLLQKISSSAGGTGVGNSRQTTGRQNSVPRTSDEKKSFVRKVSQAVGKSIMDSIGGGQDLVVSVKGIDYDSIMGQYEIDILVSFNGLIFRSDNYRVAGRITVREDGTGARFARTASNQTFKEWENVLTFIAVAEIVADAVKE